MDQSRSRALSHAAKARRRLWGLLRHRGPRTRVSWRAPRVTDGPTRPRSRRPYARRGAYGGATAADASRPRRTLRVRLSGAERPPDAWCPAAWKSGPGANWGRFRGWVALCGREARGWVAKLVAG